MNPPTFKELDTVVLTRDFTEAGLRAGDLGAVVQVYSPDTLEGEFVTASGRMQALLVGLVFPLVPWVWGFGACWDTSTGG